jgi:hypothetical protein
VDPREPDEEMYGVPVTRASSPDGRWAYTLYDSPKHPFVHALDTSGRTAACIDLDDVPTAWRATLDLRGPTLDVLGPKGGVLASIDTNTNTVTPAPEGKADAAAAGGAPAPGARDEAGTTSWLPIAAPIAVLLLLGAALRRRHSLNRGRSEPIPVEWEPSSDRHAPTV